jgi:hypothetical protein
MTATFTLSGEFGYVILTAIASGNLRVVKWL